MGCSSPTDKDETNCGDKVCEGGETQQSCSSDCGILNSCNDTDGGITVNVRGNVTGLFNGGVYTLVDFCLTNTTLQEYYCVGTSATNTTYNCKTNITMNCTVGACI